MFRLNYSNWSNLSTSTSIFYIRLSMLTLRNRNRHTVWSILWWELPLFSKDIVNNCYYLGVSAVRTTNLKENFG